jgi:hypothetical protein
VSGIRSIAGSDKNYSEVRSDGKGAREEVEDDVGRGRGGYVVVTGLAAEEQVADAAAGEITLMASGAQGRDDLQGRIELGRDGEHGCYIHCRPRCHLVGTAAVSAPLFPPTFSFANFSLAA